MKINFDNLEALYTDFFYYQQEYMYSSARYYREHGRGVRLDYAETKEERHIEHFYHMRDSADNALWAVQSVLGLDKDQRARMLSAFRALDRWYKRTNWERCLPSEVQDRLLGYIFG